MKPEIMGLCRAAVACEGWRWMPGMLTITGYRVSDADVHSNQPTLFADDIPDFSDPATLGCLLALVRQRWGRSMHVTECDGRWEFGYRYGEVLVSCCWAESEVEALLWALWAGP